MKLIDIPTDNLYKFMAISGIVLIIASYLPFYHGWMIGCDLSELKGESEIIDQKANWVREELKKLENQMDTFIVQIVQLTGISKPEIIAALNAGQSLRDISKDLEEHQIQWQEIESKFHEHHKVFREQIIKQIRLKTKSELVNRKLEALVWLARLSQIGFFTGGLLASLGFGLWYKKLQALQDLLIKQRIENGK